MFSSQSQKAKNSLLHHSAPFHLLLGRQPCKSSRQYENGFLHQKNFQANFTSKNLLFSPKQSIPPPGIALPSQPSKVDSRASCPKPGSPKDAQWPAASAPSGSLLEMQNLHLTRSQVIHTHIEVWEVSPRHSWKEADDFIKKWTVDANWNFSFNSHYARNC